MKYYSLIFIILLTLSCNNDNITKEVGISDTARLHKELYNSNHHILNELSENLSSNSDTAYMELSEYIDLVVNVLIENSGGQNSENGNLMNPNDTILWVKTLKKIDFRKNWSLGVKRLNKTESQKADNLLRNGLERIDMAEEERMKLDRLCVELRLLQLRILRYWISER